MNKNRAGILILGVIFVLACSVAVGSQPAATIQPTQPISVLLPTFTPLPTYTPYPTNTVEPTTVVLPTIAPVSLPQEWTGFYNQAGYGKVKISLLIEAMNGNTFQGKMLWHATQWYRLTITRVNGEYIQDFGDAFEQGRWDNHPDFPGDEKSGTWLKWTETEMISGNSIFTMNGWYYAHIRSDGTLVGIYYFNATEKTPTTNSFELKLSD